MRVLYAAMCLCDLMSEILMGDGVVVILTVMRLRYFLFVVGFLRYSSTPIICYGET